MSGRKTLTTFLERLVVAQVDRPWFFIAGAVVLTTFAAVLACGLRLDPSLESMLPQDSEELQNLRSVREKTGGTQQLVIAIGGGEGSEERLAFGRELLPALQGVDGIRSVELELSVDFFRERALWLVDEEEFEGAVEAAERSVESFERGSNDSALALLGQRFKALMEDQRGALPRGNVLTSQDGQDLYVVVTPSVSLTDLSEGRRVVAEIDQTVARLSPEARGLDVRTAGLLRLYQDQHRILSGDLRNASIIALVLGIIVVAAASRRFRFPLMIGLSLLPGIVWTFALVSMFQSEINVITGFMVAVLIGLGIDHGVHIIIRFRQEMGRLQSQRQALIATMTGTFPPALTSALTTAATFCCLLFAEFPGLSELGGVAGAGVLFTLLSTLLILPPLVVVWKGKPETSGVPSFQWAQQEPPTTKEGRFRTIVRPLAAAIVVLFLGVACVGAWGADAIPFRNDFREMRGESAESELFDEVSKALGGGFSPAVVVVGSLDDAERASKLIREDDDRGELDTIRVGKLLSASDLIPHNIEERRTLIDRLSKTIEDPALQRSVTLHDQRLVEGVGQVRRMTQAEPWSFDDVPVEFRRRLTTLDGEEYLVLIWPAERTDSDERKRAWERELHTISGGLDAAGVTHQIADEMLINGWVSDLVLRDRTRILPLAVALVFMILLVDLRSFKKAALVMLPLAVGVLGFLAALRLLGLEFNLFNMIVLPCIVGLGIDSAVHIYHRYQGAGPGSVLYVLRHTGVAITVAALTTAVGFGSSLVSHHAGLRSLGIVAIIGIAAVFVAATVFLPALLVTMEWISAGATKRLERGKIHRFPGLTTPTFSVRPLRGLIKSR